MAHEIMQTEEGRFAMAYRAGDDLPWHHRETNPQTFAPGASPAEIMQAACLDYQVQVVPNYFSDGTKIPDSNHISRVDNPKQIFGRFVAGNWKPVQNESLLDLAEMIEQKHGFEIITAGALFGGAKVFIQLETNKSFTLPGNDKLVSRLLSTVSHIGIESNKFIGCNTRAVCDNTIRAATGEKAGIVVHDHRVEFDPEVIEAAIALNASEFGTFAEIAQAMATRALSDSEALEFFRRVLGGRQKIENGVTLRDSVAVRKAVAAHKGQEFVAIGQENTADVVAYVDDRLKDIGRNVASGLPADVVSAPVKTINPGHDMESTRGTLWGAFNTVTWMADHQPVKNRGIDHALASNLLGDGTGGKIKAKAQRVACDLLAA